MNVWRALVHHGHELQAVQAASRFLPANAAGNDPIAVTNVDRFYQLSFYAPRQLADRLVYPADPPSSVRYMGHDTMDRGLLALRPWYPLNTVPYDDLLKSHQSFYAYGDISEWTWQTRRFVADKLSVQMVNRERTFALLRVSHNNVAVPAPGNSSELPVPGAITSGPAAPSLCDQWSLDRLCANFR